MGFLKKYYSQLLFFVIGIIAGFFISRLPLKFEEKISWITLANFFLTIALAIYLEFVVRPSFTNNRNEKDFLIDQIKDIRTAISSLQDDYMQCRDQNPLISGSKSKMLAQLRNISNQIDTLKMTDEHCSITNNTVVSDAIFKAYLDYKKSLTGYKFNDHSFFYDRLYWQKQQDSYQKLVKLMMHSIIDINKV